MANGKKTRGPERGLRFPQARKGTYVLCFDVKGLTAFNEIFLKAGDMAILEAAARIDRAASDDMLLLRIGGDEFALITGLGDEAAAQALAAQILAQNGRPIVFEGEELPLSLWCGMADIPENLRYDAFFKDMHSAIRDSKA